MGRLEIVKAKFEDGKIISLLIQESFKRQAELLNISESDYPDYVAFETEEMARNRIANTHVKILFIDTEPMGTIGSYMVDEVGYIERLAILPRFRGNDYGKRLLEKTETELFNSGCKVINLSIVASFDRLQKYYEQNGYQCNEKKRYPFLPFDVQYLSKNIKQPNLR
ncbi:GNAT family N-acetyltransferase [Paenibacillus urinalis]|uniref:GNAT family N-acetyltransferase n=1 Tax=Paenibacillus urinalis TaxID=521520 RepID=A0AAX3MU03_9BACL|nr:MULTISPECIES: GNAT family N-acetyltransferase [Paenibacillus]WDH80566.1 GNAT family N-acetyltransferase [Paenibacillus urinalis]WDH96608.1 GNAT family N-acetyltransferase [Paenibacillus urinalis]WDI00252.1 GNAT family N-acetyltransferase [Paenibacillus urinalis]GAK40762.1 hypothetical protein TCA2_3252 [Paenibacillus sp. TCA20]